MDQTAGGDVPEKNLQLLLIPREAEGVTAVGGVAAARVGGGVMP